MAAFVNPEFEFGGMNHLALTCSDMQRTMDFYTNILGMKFVIKTPIPDSNRQSRHRL